MFKLGEIYSSGLAQMGYNPSKDDLDKAIRYLKAAVDEKRFDPEIDDPNNRGYLQLTKDYLDIQKRRAEKHNENEPISQSEIDEKRRRYMEVSPAAQQRLNAEKAALTKLHHRLLQEGW